MTRKGAPCSVRPTSMTSTMPGWRMVPQMRASVKKRSMAVGSVAATQGEHDLDGHLAAEGLVDRGPDHAHAALAEEAEQPVAAPDHVSRGRA